MLHKNLYLNLIIRIILIAATCLGLAFVWLTMGDYFVVINIVALLVIQVVMLVRYLNRLNRDLENFFSAISNSDTSLVYKRMAASKSFANLYSRIDEVNAMIQNLRFEAENQRIYLQNLIENVSVGLLSVDEKGGIGMMNSAAKRLLGVPSARSLDSLSRVDTMLPEIIRAAEPNTPELISLRVNDQTLRLALRVSHLTMQGQKTKLVSLQNIVSELEDAEIESYQKLIRILTHEIMNSSGPILSSIQTIRSLIAKPGTGECRELNELTQDILEDIVRGLSIVEERSIGLAEFISKFRNLTLFPEPVPTTINIKELLNDTITLMQGECRKCNARIETEILQTGLTIEADRKQIEQILINLVKNSLYALQGKLDARILLRAVKQSKGIVVVEVDDNGSGIDEENIDNVFVPFFSTKENGSGIGLSLSRQIMRNHKGKISIQSRVGMGTVVRLEFSMDSKL